MLLKQPKQMVPALLEWHRVPQVHSSNDALILTQTIERFQIIALRLAPTQPHGLHANES